MKVLMLGWEFPPHISGGLGTACFGLTQGLAHTGTEVVFVVPRTYGDEDAAHVQIVGCNQVTGPTMPESTRVEEGAASVDTPGPTGVESTSSPHDPPEDPQPLTESWMDPGVTSPRVLAVSSSLQPYQTAESYREWVASLEDSDAPAEARLPSTPATRRAFTAVEQVLAPFGWSEGAVRFVRQTLGGPDRFELSGSYGPSLMAEVARFATAVGELAQRIDFDVIHAHDWMTFPAGLAVARLLGKPLVIHVHASEYDRSGEDVNWEIRDLEEMGIRQADRIVCVSHYTANILKHRYGADPTRLRVVHNAVTHREQREHYHLEKAIEEPIVLFLGRVTFQKGPEYFLEAAARVIQIEPGVKFVMSGSGDMLPRMVERAALLGIARHVHFTGFLRGRDVERMYAMADLYVMPSVSEPFGISPLEAMALDCPVIVSRQSGVSEILTNALKVDFWDVEDLANKILALLRYPALTQQLTEEGRNEIRRVRWDASAQRVVGVYRELVS